MTCWFSLEIRCVFYQRPLQSLSENEGHESAVKRKETRWERSRLLTYHLSCEGWRVELHSVEENTNTKWKITNVCRASFWKVHICWLLRLWSCGNQDIASCDSPLILLPSEASSTVRIRVLCSRLLNSDVRSAWNNKQCLGSHKLPFQIKTQL